LLVLRIAAEDEWLAEQQAQPPTSKGHKIVPARRKKLAKARERLAQLADEHLVECEQIAAQLLTVESEVLWASLVVAS